MEACVALLLVVEPFYVICHQMIGQSKVLIRAYKVWVKDVHKRWWVHCMLSGTGVKSDFRTCWYCLIASFSCWIRLSSSASGRYPPGMT